MIKLSQNDITKVSVDAIVNAANTGLRGGGGVDGAIHRAGGPAILAECRTLGGCPTGQAVRTTAGNLPAKMVIHTVGPIWQGGSHGEAEQLAAAYHNSLTLAVESGAETIAFPSISTGIYGYPIQEAAEIALKTALAFSKAHPSLKEIHFVLFSTEDLTVYETILEQLTPNLT